ncbi:hypothetical protein M378DRAFT_85745 [Amanita muscaria Koide BX008]|uniref:Probable methionine--tRNA ligase, mitochondrial n=1 Tax=Amanita muscaria (strain Koide BX008) TaxID=946122 RepID=A0A0C2WCE0_AMAMK|nr:hypothetical protein M378DRAFT_85745 [Amanita muscaria Koide BX008]
MFPRFQFTARRVWLQRLQTRLASGKTVSEVEKPYYITSPIFYPNAAPHIGHLYSLVIADIYTRYQRLVNPERPVHFLAGTDEHGLKIQRAAQAKGMEPKEFCDQLSSRFRILAERAQISNTCFMRTTNKAHYETVQHVWRKLAEKGLFYKGNYSGWYSVTDECFYTDAQVTKSSSATVASETGSPVEWQEETNYMFRLSAFQFALLDHYTSTDVIFPVHHQSHIIDTLRQPLEDLSVSRPRSRLSWGVPVPADPDQTVYVWIDALLVYLSGIGYPWKTSQPTGWPVDLQVIGKDILRFHAIYFPAMLLALGLPLPKRLLAHAHWTVEQKKMSKSLGNVADPFESIDKYGVDVVRYYLARVGGRFRDDVDWSQGQLDKYFKEIQSLLGNFLLRVTSDRIKSAIKGASSMTLEDIARDKSSPNAPFVESQRALADKLTTCLDQMEVSDAVEHVVELLRVANKAVTDIAPWKPSTAPDVAYASYLTSLETLRVAGICLQPFIPNVAAQLLDALGIPPQERTWGHAREMRTWDGSVKGIKLF